jgi:hypothetical protein
MAGDEGAAQMLRGSLGDLPCVEKRMFGGVCFMLNGHMTCGTTKGGAIFRVGKTGDVAALALTGVRPMNFTGKDMAGFVECGPDVLAEDGLRDRLVELALAFNKTLPPK